VGGFLGRSRVASRNDPGQGLAAAVRADGWYRFFFKAVSAGSISSKRRKNEGRCSEAGCTDLQDPYHLFAENALAPHFISTS